MPEAGWGSNGCGLKHVATCVVAVLVALLLVRVVHASEPAGIRVSVDVHTGQYTVRAADPAWTFRGSVDAPLSGVRTTAGHDSLGDYHQVTFRWHADNAYAGSIRWYDASPVVLFTLTTPQGAKHVGATFPDFRSFPSAMHTFSFVDDNFAPPVFGKLTHTSTPWLFFNDRDQAFILSPASDFIVARMRGDAGHAIGSGLNPGLHDLPNGFAHRSILVLGKGIHHAWQRWGHALRALYHKHRPANDADPVLKYYGYWTDNGAAYYYNYDTSLGYEGTLLKVHRQYRAEGIHLGYMQLDSWWYEKSIYDADGKPDAGHKNPDLPKGRWNRYGGLMSYRADPFLFPHGLAAFQRKLGLPLVVHNRWIDPHSPYHKRYRISGYAAVDSTFWNHIADFMQHAGIVDYEQDWLNYIYAKSPRMADTLSVGNAFADGMADATRRRGIDMQYCMAPPRFFLQGVKYSNLTTIRTAGDRFGPDKWRHFIYTSQLASAMGIWPWSDTFMSHETGNMIVSVLSGGAVGTGDALGHEDKANIRMASRADGVLVKPDAVLLPMDSDYIHAADGVDAPMLAFTDTRHGTIRTDYVFAFAQDHKPGESFGFHPAVLGQQGRVVVYDPLTHRVKAMPAGGTFHGTVGTKGYSYYIVAPVTSGGIAFLGDAGKIASTGRQRIAGMVASKHVLTVRVRFVPGEHAVTLRGWTDRPVHADRGTLHTDHDTGLFTLHLPTPAAGGGVETVRFTGG